MKACKFFACLLLPLFLYSAASAVVITDLGFTVGKVTSSGPINLTYEDIEPSNPPVPLVMSDVIFDTSGWSADGDYLSSSAVEITGFDLPLQKITISMDCARYQDDLAGFPTAVMLCSTSGIVSVGAPTLFGTPIDIDPDMDFIMTENGAVIDTLGMTSMPFLATASGTGAVGIPVTEPGSVLSAMFGVAALFGIFVNRRL